MDTTSLIRFVANRNPEWVEKRVKEAYAYKEGRRYDGKAYNSLADIWRECGKITYGAFRNRLYRGNTLKYSLGEEV